GMLGRGALAFSRHKKRAFAALIQRRSLAGVTCFHATSEQEHDDIRAFGLTAPVAVVPNGIDVPDTGEIMQPALASDRQRSVLYLGRVHAKKGIDRLLRAWANVEAANPNWRLQIVGPAEEGHDVELLHLAQRLQLPRVVFHPGMFGAEKLAAYRDADLFVLPTLDENFGMVVGEALAHGTPVICTKGAPWAGLSEKGCGWWIDHGVDALTATLSESMAMPREKLRAMGLVGRSWMEADYSWDRIVLDMLSVYRWCQTKSEKPDFIRLT
ncbi:MAG: glycosyltransferase, partial [Pseudomonadota bacterium]